MSAYSGAARMPDLASRKLAVTSWVLLPIEETIPIPVTTTRRMRALLLTYFMPAASCSALNRPTFRSLAL